MALENKILTGGEANILCFFAQIHNDKEYINSEDYKIIIKKLSPYALAIGEAIFGYKKDKDAIDAAECFIEWAESLGLGPAGKI